MALFDTHAHLDQAEFDEDRSEVIQRARQAGVEAIVAVGCTADSSAAAVRLAQQYDIVLAAVGIQPNYCAEAAPGDWDRIEQLLDAPKVVALGETGLDRHWNYAPFELQQEYFARHLRLAQERDLPVVIHTRQSDADVVKMLRAAAERGPLTGVMHSFTGTAETAAECIALGMHISFAGMVTFKKSADLRAVAEGVPADRILIETDSPYLSPHPRRGRRNEPAHVAHTARCLAEARGESFEEFCAGTTTNARRLFGIPRP